MNNDIILMKDGSERINVLDQGYVRKIGTFGSDLTVVNAAKVSFDKEAQEMRPRDEKLMKFLWDHEHTSPFRQCLFQVEVYAPLMVARQWWKYVIGSDHSMDAWNESSRRYITEEVKFYIPRPNQWRSAPENRKQGSGAMMEIDETTMELTERLMERADQSLRDYEWAMENGVAPEQARVFLLGYNMYVRWRWTGSLQSGMHFLRQRLAHDAQAEIQQYAEAVYELLAPDFPHALKQLDLG